MAFVVIVALTGGASRADVLSLVVLRPLAAIFAGYAILAAPSGHLRCIAVPLAIVGLCAAVIGLHLVPLPPAMWHSLPMREVVVAIDAALGQPSAWRPLALSPAGAWNALFSLTVPATAILLYGALDNRDRPTVLLLWIGAAIASAALGLAQMLGDAEGVLYLYAVTTSGLPVGLLANANHQAMLLASAIPVTAVLAVRRESSAAMWFGAIAIFGFLFVALLGGSRAGTALSVLAGAVAALIYSGRGVDSQSRSQVTTGSRRNRWSALSGSRRSIVLVVAALAMAGVFAAVSSVSDGGVGFSSIARDADRQELRLSALPVLLKMLGDVWTVGLGAGSFVPAYQIVEPLADLGPYYLNHAHNDWLELMLEYGIAGAAFLLILLVAVWRAAKRVVSDGSNRIAMRAGLLFPILVFALGSIIDYPLRVPLVQVLAILWLLGLGDGALLTPRKARSRRS
ncbi:O-antigen ligase [Parafrankia sp. BMG5.11]|uniref:O-antigen ligase family protein n=1 Tax=Parafrankia sp. BMG5.11 TaxID=222540 RepID=UPI0014051EBC|nr:O-antigen ligase family protein [Parafrankia sp. BMG5.11]